MGPPPAFLYLGYGSLRELAGLMEGFGFVWVARSGTEFVEGVIPGSDFGLCLFGPPRQVGGAELLRG